MSNCPEEFEAEIDGFPTVAGGHSQHGRESVEVLATEFAEKTRQGLRPSVEDYAVKYPHLAEQIRELFPAVLALEQWKTDKESDSLQSQVPREFNLEKLGDCEIVREIARGGMGVVFEALWGKSKRHVAVKLLPWRFHLGLERWRERFRQEAKTVARLNHRNIVPIYTFGEHEGYCYYVMQLINGVSLDNIIKRLQETDGIVYADEIARSSGKSKTEISQSKLPDETTVGNKKRGADEESPPQKRDSRDLRRNSWQAFAKVACQAAQALRCAHDNGVLHNDVKPGNLMLDTSGRVLMTDFGVARSLQASATTKGDRLTGTLRFMAPERFAGECDARSDVYSLGITLYELVTLMPAFQGSNRPKLVELITLSEPRRPRAINPEIPRDLETIILTAIARDPGERYRSAGALASDLLQFINGRPIQAKHLGMVRKFLRLCRRRLTRNPRRSRSRRGKDGA